MGSQAELSSDPGCTSTQTASAGQCFVQSLRNNLWTRHSVIELAQNAYTKADRISLTPTSDQYTWFQELRPEHLNAQYSQNFPFTTSQTEGNTFSSCHIDNHSLNNNNRNKKTPLHIPSPINLTHTSPDHLPNFSSVNLTTHISSSRDSVEQYNHTQEIQVNHYSINMLENCPGMKEWSSRSCMGETQEEGTIKLERSCTRLGSMQESFSSSFKYQILEPIQTSRTAHSLRRLETEFVNSYFQIKKKLDEQRKIYNQSKEFLRAYTLTEQGQTRFVVTFGSVEDEILPRIHDLQEVLKDLESSLMECTFKITNENDCSQIWIKLEAVKDQAMFLGDALEDFGRTLRRMHWWMIKYHIPACVHFYSQIKDTYSSRPTTSGTKGEDLELLEEDVDVDVDSPERVLQEAFNNNVTTQTSITFYQDCTSSIKTSLDAFLLAIPSGTLSIDELVIWLRLSILSLADISRGLESFSKISKKLDSKSPSDLQDDLSQ